MTLELTQNAYFCLQHGSPEYQVYQCIPDEGISYHQILNKLGIVGKIGYRYGLEYHWFKFDKETYKIFKNKDIKIDDICQYIKDIQDGFIPADKKIIKLLKEREYINII